MATKTDEKAPEAITPATSIDGPMTVDEALDLPEPEGWNPSPGDKIQGRVMYVTETEGGHPEYGVYPLVAIWTGTEAVALHAFHSTFRNAINRANPQPGDLIGVKYLGLKTENKKGEPVGFGGKGYENYKVIVQKAQAAPALSS